MCYPPGSMKARDKALAVGGATALLVALAYAPVVGNGFVFDDLEYIVDNASLRIPTLRQFAGWALTSSHEGNWHPLTWLSHYLDFQLFGLDARGPHLVSLLLHLLNTLLVFRVWRRLTGSLWGSAALAALWGLHPLRVESVAWASERKDVLSACFWLLALGAYTSYARRPSARGYALVAAFFAAGLMSKPMVLTLPLALLLADFWPLGRLRVAGLPAAAQPGPARAWGPLLEKAPLLALSAACALVTLRTQAASGAITGVYDWQVRLANALWSYAAYLGKTVWPAGLAFYYPHPGETLALWPALGVGLLGLAVTGGLGAAARRAPFALAGWLWFLAALVPVSGLVQAGDQALADRYTYLPHLGLFTAALWAAAAALREPRRRRVAAPLVTATVLLLAAATSVQVRYWRDDETLCRRALRVTQGNWVVHRLLAITLEGRGRLTEALEQYRAAARIYAPGVDYDLGILYAKMGQPARAESYYRRAIAVRPAFMPAHFNLAVLLAGQGRVEEAVEEYLQALALAPQKAEIHHGLGLALERTGRAAEARRQLREALRLDPGAAGARAALERLVGAPGR